MSDAPIETLVFDLGNVVVDWNPRHLYRKVFAGDEASMERFLANVCTPEWNAQHDAGRPFAEGVAEASERHPEFAEQIALYWERWEEMVPGPVSGAPELLRELAGSGVPLYALSNWSAETWPRARGRFDFWDCFRGVVISGEVALVKPDPAIYEHLLATYGIARETALFIDDSAANVTAAREVGMQAHHFESVSGLRAALSGHGIACRTSG